MKSNPNSTHKLVKAFIAGNKRAYVSAVSHMGIPTAANALTRFLGQQSESFSSIPPQATALLKSSVIRGIPQSEEFIHFLISSLASLQVEERKKGKILNLFLAEVKPTDLDNIDLVKLGAPALTRLVKVLPSLNDPGHWAEFAIDLKDKTLLNLIKPYLSDSEIFSLWDELQFSCFQPRLGMLLACDLHPASAEEKETILQQAVYNPRDQTEIVRLLVNAWPGIVATFKILPLHLSAHYYWTGETVRFLIARGPCLERENWIKVFFFHLSEIFANQVAALSGKSPVIDWNMANKAGDGFLLEIYETMGDVAKEHRMHILETLLGAGADPRPLLARKARFELSPDEEKVVLQFAHLWTSKSAALEPEKTLQPISTVLNLV